MLATCQGRHNVGLLFSYIKYMIKYLLSYYILNNIFFFSSDMSIILFNELDLNPSIQSVLYRVFYIFFFSVVDFQGSKVFHEINVGIDLLIR